MTTTITPLYRNETPYPFCPGCGHGSILDRLNEALEVLGNDPAQVVIVSDIGCAGLSDQYFSTSAFHGLHGRSITYATGIKLANPDLEVIVVMGDGGTGIGGAHLINAARRNIGITVLVFNNMNFGMTGGQHSTTTPEEAVTSTTPGGNLEHPLDICGTVGVNGAAYVYRGTSFDRSLPERIAEAVRKPGFALLDIWELCTAYFALTNRFGRKTLDKAMQGLGFESGVLYDREVREYSRALRTSGPGERSRLAPRPIPPGPASELSRPITMVVAGSAGAKVRSAVRLAAEAAIRSGLWASQRDDYPVTVKTGHSVSTLLLATDPTASPDPVPDVVVLLSEDGVGKATPAIERMEATGLVIAAAGLELPETAAEVSEIDPTAAGRLPKSQTALALVAAALLRLEIVPASALEKAAAGPFAEENLRALEAASALAREL